MDITILYDNTSLRDDLISDWGFACLVESERFAPILFDTGADGWILLVNMERLGVEVGRIGSVFISHNHFDHTGGLGAFLQVNPAVSVFAPYPCGTIDGAEQVTLVRESFEIGPGILSTGVLSGIEQSLLLDEEQGLVVIVGCAHPGMGSILEAASARGPINALVGGMHGFRDLDLLDGIEVICPTHCTQHQDEIGKACPLHVTPGGVGKRIRL
ncbi:MAG: MBL fold metallo-hydrolase [Desulfomonilia bacterium]|nr:MBL fold metallo-hydrolase [Desulfomonilia bacterium]